VVNDGLIALIIGTRMTRTVTAAVAQLHDATKHVDRGDFSHRIPVNSRDQLAANLQHAGYRVSCAGNVASAPDRVAVDRSVLQGAQYLVRRAQQRPLRGTDRRSPARTPGPG